MWPCRDHSQQYQLATMGVLEITRTCRCRGVEMSFAVSSTAPRLLVDGRGVVLFDGPVVHPLGVATSARTDGREVDIHRESHGSDGEDES